jgi:TRAP-type C4-dicarboxylate transport system permease small subunit
VAEPAACRLRTTRHRESGMDKFWKIIEWILEKLKVAGAACLTGMTFLTCIDVVGRFFRHPVLGSVELTGFMATLSVAMALPYTHQVKGHIGVEILVRLFSERTQIIIDLCAGILSLLLFAIITWRMTIYARTIQESGEVSISLKLPEYFIMYAVAFCLLIFTLIILRDTLTTFKKLKTK